MWTCEGMGQGRGGGSGCHPLRGSPPDLCFRAYEDMPQNVVAATSSLKTFNLIPAVGEQRVPILPASSSPAVHGPVQILYLPPPQPSPYLPRTEHRENAILEKGSVQAWVIVLGVECVDRPLAALIWLLPPRAWEMGSSLAWACHTHHHTD